MERDEHGGWVFLGRALLEGLEPELQSTLDSQTFPALGTTSLLASQPTNLQTFASLRQSSPKPTPNSPPPANTLRRPGFSDPAREAQWKRERERRVM